MRITAKRECCGALPNIVSYWPASKNYKVQNWYLICPYCGVATEADLPTEEDAVKCWDAEKIDFD